MKPISRRLVAVLAIAASITPACAVVEAHFDYLNGHGKFDNNPNLDGWDKIMPLSYSIAAVQDNSYLQLTKKPPLPTEEPEEGVSIVETDYAKGFFDDMLVYKWVNGIKPRHVHFEVMTSRTDIETCGVHMYNLE